MRSQRAPPRPFPTISAPLLAAFASIGMIVVMAEAANSPTLSHIIIPEHIENPISWCEMVIAWHDIHNTNHEMTISHHNCRYTMYNYGIGAEWSKIQKAEDVF